MYIIYIYILVIIWCQHYQTDLTKDVSICQDGSVMLCDALWTSIHFTQVLTTTFCRVVIQMLRAECFPHFPSTSKEGLHPRSEWRSCAREVGSPRLVGPEGSWRVKGLKGWVRPEIRIGSVKIGGPEKKKRQLRQLPSLASAFPT